MTLFNKIMLPVSAVVFIVFLVLYCVKRHKALEEPDEKKAKKMKRGPFIGMLFGGWAFIACAVNLISGGTGGIHVKAEILAPRKEIFGVSLAETTITAYGVLAVVAVLCILFRVFCVPKFKDEPKGLQNLMEAAVEAVDSFTYDTAGKFSPVLPSYIFAVAVLLIGCAVSELFGLRPPTADIEFTFSLALCTFFLINFYGIKEKKLSGRIKTLASPSPILLPIRVVTDCATPISLACRLFGNMLGGMIVMDLLKNSLGGYAVGITSLAGLYFNVFHPLIQTYIFVILSLTFIREATE